MPTSGGFRTGSGCAAPCHGVSACREGRGLTGADARPTASSAPVDTPGVVPPACPGTGLRRVRPRPLASTHQRAGNRWGTGRSCDLVSAVATLAMCRLSVSIPGASPSAQKSLQLVDADSEPQADAARDKLATRDERERVDGRTRHSEASRNIAADVRKTPSQRPARAVEGRASPGPPRRAGGPVDPVARPVPRRPRLDRAEVAVPRGLPPSSPVQRPRELGTLQGPYLQAEPARAGAGCHPAPRAAAACGAEEPPARTPGLPTSRRSPGSAPRNAPRCLE